MNLATFLAQAFGDEEGSPFPPSDKDDYQVVAQIHNGDLGADEEFDIEYVNWLHDNRQVVLRLK